MADFSTLGNDKTVPYSGETLNDNALGLTNPDSVLSGTNRGTQLIGSSTLQVDSTQNLITVKGNSLTNANNVLRFGQVSTGFLGMAVNNGTLDTMFAGQDSSGNTVVKVAKTGFDAKTATNDQLVFNSAQNALKVALTGTTSITPPASWPSGNVQTITIPHGLSTTPAALVYVNNPPIQIAGYGGAQGLTSLPSSTLFISATGGATTLFYNQARVDNTNLYIDLSNVTATTQTGFQTLTWTYKYYLLQETAI